MGVRLTVQRLDGTVVEYHDDVAVAIRKEADHAAAEAEHDLLGGPTSDYVRQRVIERATQQLRRAGDTYEGPAGAFWQLELG